MLARRWLSLCLVALLVFSLLPPLGASANVPLIEVTNLYVTKSDSELGPDGRPSNLSLVTRSTAKEISVIGTYNGMAEQDLAKLYYEVTNMDTGVVSTVKDNKAVPAGSQTFRFDRVALTEGLNRIVIKMEGIQLQSAPAWVFYSAVPTLQNLNVLGQPLVDGMIVPQRNPVGTATLLIGGEAPNATDVRLYVSGATSGAYPSQFVPSTGQFFFYAAEAGNPADVQLRAGDNKLTIVASNPTRSAQVERRIVFNNGRAFAFNVKVNPGAGPEWLVDQPVISKARNGDGTVTVNLQAYLKINKQGTNGLEYDQVEIQVGNQTLTVDPNALTSVTSLETPDYKVFDWSQSVTFTPDPNDATVPVSFTFVSTATGERYTGTTHTFTYRDPNAPYVDRVTLKRGTAELAVFNGMQLDELPAVFRVYTNPAATSVKLDVRLPDGQPDSGWNAAQDASVQSKGGGVFEITANRLPEGQRKLLFIPVASGGDYLPGRLEYTVSLVRAPYVIVDNFTNGQVFDQLAQFLKARNSNNRPVIEGRLINVPNKPEDLTNYYRVTVTVNGISDDLKPGELGSGSGNGLPFTFNLQTRPQMTLNDGENGRPEGRNEIIIRVYDKKTNQLLTEAKYEVFFFKTKSPRIVSLKLDDPLVSKFTVPDPSFPLHFVTKARSITLKGNFAYADKLKVTVTPPNGQPVTEWYEYDPTDRKFYKRDGSSRTEFSPQSSAVLTELQYVSPQDNGRLTAQYPLALGTTTIEFTVTNASGLSHTMLVEVVREPLPYDIVFPDLDKTNVVNTDFVQLHIVAEGADRVVFKDGEAKKGKVYDRDGSLVDGFIHEVKGLKPGLNKITFDVYRGKEKTTGVAEIRYVNAPEVGAAVKVPLKNGKISVFNKQLEIAFDKGTAFKRNDPQSPHLLLSDQRELVIGIADPVDGRVDKVRFPTPAEKAKFGWWWPALTNPVNLIVDTTGRFRMASPVYWIDAGLITDAELKNLTPGEAVRGSGLLPYEPGKEYYLRINPRDAIVPTKPGKLTLKYDPKIRPNAWRYLTVFHYGYYPDETGTVRLMWKNIGGVVDPSKQTITVPLAQFGYYVVMYMHNSFNDVIDHPWARDDLDTLYAKGYMMNKEPNLFVPNEPITRGEFVTMLVKMFEIPLDYEGSLTFTTCAPTTRSARGCSTTNTSRRRPGRASCAGPSAAALSRTSPWRAKTRR